MKTRDRVLAYLKESKHCWVSGQWLSQNLAISRTAISKQVRQLKKSGYPIETSTRRGYRLGDIPDLLLPNEIRDGLETGLFGAVGIHYFYETDSANRQAGILAASGVTEGTIVIAEAQFQGKGRKGRSWFSPEGKGIYLSLILKPLISPSSAPVVTLMTGVAVAETLQCLTNLDISIKWPNDILVKNRKIAGILTEINTDMDRIDHIIVGIGINVNILSEVFNKAGLTEATSIMMETGTPFSRIKIIQSFLKIFESYYRTLQEEGFESIRNRWKKLSGIIKRQISVKMIDHTLIGEAMDIDHEGVLILRDSKGEYHRVISGDVVLLNT